MDIIVGLIGLVCLILAAVFYFAEICTGAIAGLLFAFVVCFVLFFALAVCW